MSRLRKRLDECVPAAESAVNVEMNSAQGYGRWQHGEVSDEYVRLH